MASIQSTHDEDVEGRLRSMAFDASEARDAIRGLGVPRALGRRIARLCVIRGIRYHAGLAEKGQLQELRHVVPEFARALDARAIMSNSIPDMPHDDVPYCIWHPDTATEDTYRALVARYPGMAYHVARACAVAGYTGLYSELDVLPDVSVAEEARACGSKEIFESIMRQPVKYRIMDDYTRSVNLKDPRPSGLNGDTAVRPTLDVKQKFGTPRGPEQGAESRDDGDDDSNDGDDDLFGGGSHLFPEPGFVSNTFNITEDMNIDDFSTPEEDAQAGDSAMADLLAKPLPPDLPEGNKDVLILAAAYSGDMDRYARLRRPVMVRSEAGCIVRGIYHSHFFATWWASQPLPSVPYGTWIAQAMHARMIMSNDLSRLTAAVPREHLPYLIWYPSVAKSTTYAELARRLPSMRQAVLRAAVYAKDRDLFDSMLHEYRVEPDPYVLAEATAGLDTDTGDEPPPPSPYFTRRLLDRAAELGLDLGSATSAAAVQRFGAHFWKRYSVRADARDGIGRSDNWLYDGPALAAEMGEPGIYNGVWADASVAELYASVPPAWRPADGRGVQLEYGEGL